jgi:hypothetical protein
MADLTATANSESTSEASIFNQSLTGFSKAFADFDKDF